MRMNFIIILLFLSVSIFAEKETSEYFLSVDHKEAYLKILSLQFEEGISIIEKIKIEQPQNILVYHIENYVDFIHIFINEDKEEFEKREKNKEIRLSHLRKGSLEDPYYLFSQAEIHLQWALSRIKFEEYLKAAIEVNKAIGMLERNRERFPDFISNKKSLSILHAIAGTIPDKYMGALRIISNLNGTIDQGLREIDEVLVYASESDYFFKEEAIAIKSLILQHLKNEKQEAYDFLSNSSLDAVHNPLATYLLASAASSSGHNDSAIEILSNHIISHDAQKFHYLDLMLGSAKLSRLDEGSDQYIKAYINNFNGQNYIKDAYRKLAWYELIIHKNTTRYKHFMNKVVSVGSNVVDEDKAAYKEAENGMIPHPELLKARVLFDGGYGERALRSMLNINQNHLTKAQSIEYYYRLGRIQQILSNNPESIKQYSNCIKVGKSSSLYYTCNAALQMGLIYENTNDTIKAEEYFRLCLSMNPSEYKTGLHQKAKAGISRVRE